MATLTWLEASTPEELSGRLALLLSTAVHQRDLELFRQVLRAIACHLTDAQAKAIFRTIRTDLAEELQQWMDAAIVQIQSGENDGE